MLAALDGFKGRWVCVLETERGISASLIPLDLLQTPVLLECDLVGIDVPIGLTDRGCRQADVLARRVLGPRAASVFPPPSLSAIAAVDYPDALQRNRAATGKGLSKQAFNLFPAIRAAASFAEVRPQGVFEVHPELSFCHMAGPSAPLDSKHQPTGGSQRLELLREELDQCTHRLPKAATGDLLDALTVLWTVRRLAKGEARSLPSPPELNERGEPMAIWT